MYPNLAAVDNRVRIGRLLAVAVKFEDKRE